METFTATSSPATAQRATEVVRGSSLEWSPSSSSHLPTLQVVLPHSDCNAKSHFSPVIQRKFSVESFWFVDRCEMTSQSTIDFGSSSLGTYGQEFSIGIISSVCDFGELLRMVDSARLVFSQKAYRNVHHVNRKHKEESRLTITSKLQVSVVIALNRQDRVHEVRISNLSHICTQLRRCTKSNLEQCNMTLMRWAHTRKICTPGTNVTPLSC